MNNINDGSYMQPEGEGQQNYPQYMPWTYFPQPMEQVRYYLLLQSVKSIYSSFKRLLFSHKNK